ncbi:MAG: hypothetical protein UZ13_00010 [Chloroflexi bacterium OLB13]|nr:MAG: hypothetical protein UZ13_00010 [Chloroflexi bacterium OLB13]
MNKQLPGAGYHKAIRLIAVSLLLVMAILACNLERTLNTIEMSDSATIETIYIDSGETHIVPVSVLADTAYRVTATSTDSLALSDIFVVGAGGVADGQGCKHCTSSLSTGVSVTIPAGEARTTRVSLYPGSGGYDVILRIEPVLDDALPD